MVSARMFSITIVLLLFGFGSSAQAGLVINNTPYSGDWQDIYHSFSVQDSFETTSLPAGVSITLSGGRFLTPQTYTSLPGLYDPRPLSTGGSGFPNNLWDGNYMVTNYGYDETRPVGQNWINDWAPTGYDRAARITFNFASGVSALGIGLSNFQAADTGPQPNHLLFIDGVALTTDLETLVGPSFIYGAYAQNGYLTITGNGGTLIQSIGFEGIQFVDGMNFDVLGFNAVLNTPEPTTLAAAFIGFVMNGVLVVFLRHSVKTVRE